jgi:hypothetical protein
MGWRKHYPQSHIRALSFELGSLARAAQNGHLGQVSPEWVAHVASLGQEALMETERECTIIFQQLDFLSEVVKVMGARVLKGASGRDLKTFAEWSQRLERTNPLSGRDLWGALWNFLRMWCRLWGWRWRDR